MRRRGVGAGIHDGAWRSGRPSIADSDGGKTGQWSLSLSSRRCRRVLAPLSVVMVFGLGLSLFALLGTGRTGMDPPPLVFAVGLVRDLSAVRPEVLGWLAEMNCRHGVGVHVVSGASTAVEGWADLDSRRTEILHNMEEGDGEMPPNYGGESGGAEILSHPRCGLVAVVPEDAHGLAGYAYGTDPATGGPAPPPPNRVDRIAALRDFQRNLLRRYYVGDGTESGDIRGRSGGGGGIRDGAVIVVDLDLAALPPPRTVLRVTAAAATATAGPSGGYPHDVVCAAGVTAASRKELWYYDTYATVLLPDTYVHPLGRRKLPHHYPGEDPGLVRSEDQKNGNFTQGHLMRYLQGQAEKSPEGTVPVRSCFGGLAIYSSQTFFEQKCRYRYQYHHDRHSLDLTGSRTRIGTGAGKDADVDAGADENVVNLERYASRADGRPCEHVVFHDCLLRQPRRWGGGERDQRRDPENGHGSKTRGRSIAIMPHLVTLWTKDVNKG